MTKILLSCGRFSTKVALKVFLESENMPANSFNDFLYISTDKQFLERLNVPELLTFHLPYISSNENLNIQNGIDFSQAEIKLVLKLQSYSKIVLVIDSFIFPYLFLLNALSELSLEHNIQLQVLCLDSFSHQHFLDKNLENKITYIVPKEYVQFLPNAKNQKKNFEKKIVKQIIMSAK